MTVEQHPSDVDLFELAAGTLLDRGLATVARHVSECTRCREFVQAMEHVGGLLLEELPPSSMASGSLSEMIAMIDQTGLTRSEAPSGVSVLRSSSSRQRRFGGERLRPWRRRLLQALPIAAVIVLSVGVAYFLIVNPVSSPVPTPSGLKTISIAEAYQHPIPVGLRQIEERPRYVGSSDDETRPLAYERQVVFFHTNEPPGTLLINTSKNFIYLVLGNNRALRYVIGVGHDCFHWQGLSKVADKTEWPEWTPSQEDLWRQPDWPRSMQGGPGNPLGARAIDLHEAGYRIHGTNEPETIGNVVSSGCFHLENSDVIDLYQRLTIGARVIVNQAPVI